MPDERNVIDDIDPVTQKFDCFLTESRSVLQFLSKSFEFLLARKKAEPIPQIIHNRLWEQLKVYATSVSYSEFECSDYNAFSWDKEDEELELSRTEFEQLLNDDKDFKEQWSSNDDRTPEGIPRGENLRHFRCW